MLYALFIMIAISLSRAIPSWSQAILIEPKRVLLDDRHRMRAVNLYNNTDDTLSYSIDWVHLRMDEDGRYENIDTVQSSDNLADTLVRFFPPEITLAPHSSQVIRLRYLKPRGAVPGESCSHLLFSEVDPGEPIEWKLRDTSHEGARVRVRPLFCLSIPVIVRSDTSVASVQLDSFSISTIDTGRNATVGLQIERSGMVSCYGALLIKYISPAGQEEDLGRIDNLSVFPPLPFRNCKIRVKVPPDVNLDTGELMAEYHTAPDDDAPFRVIASAQLDLGH